MAVTAVAPASVGVKVGDFFVSSWGYDQTNVDFYKVVGLTPKGVKIQKWSNAVVESSGPQDYVVPGDGPATYYDYSAAGPDADYWERQAARVEVPAKVVTKRLSSYSPDSAYVSLNSYSSASKWNGKPCYETASGYGH